MKVFGCVVCAYLIVSECASARKKEAVRDRKRGREREREREGETCPTDLETFSIPLKWFWLLSFVRTLLSKALFFIISLTHSLSHAHAHILSLSY